ncbi:glycosyltransferase family 4 protein [Gimesia chilikensis]|uniref:glycosyltransferase family 4 protein n=1 Tax=Gimesia chilikensis TaxID=2605989 RepID=UPI0011ED193D|nr:glycosyltransferase family 4 protein [Gimesia chilikensis]KAA0136940.1 glycosyltransferase family 4 protein [Gimesia chilikensis]
MSTILSQPVDLSDSGEQPRPQESRKRLLLVSYHFPPVGGAGVQRPVKFVKYLKQFGWDVSVLMAANPSVPVFDNSLLVDIPEGTHLEKARTWEPDYTLKKNMAQKQEEAQKVSLSGSLKSSCKKVVKAGAGMLLQPDAQILWYPNALKAGKRLLKRVPHDAILATAPPYSNLILASKLKKIFHLPLISDFRDEWDLSSKYLENHQRDRISDLIQTRLQKKVMRHSDAIVATTKASTQRLLDRAEQFGASPVGQCIYNGYDPDDFDTPHETSSTYTPESGRKFRIVYTGTLWNLTTIEPLVRAIEAVHQSQPAILKHLELQVIGRKTPEQREILDRLNQTDCTLICEDYCAHHEALKKMAAADALCLLLSDVEGADRVAPAKLFEYLAIQREILSITPEGETAGILQDFWPEGNFRASETDKLAHWLINRLSGQTVSPMPHPEKREQFQREHQAGQLAELLNQLVHHRI